MATTQAALRQRIRNNVYGQAQSDLPFTTTLNAAIANGTDATITVIDGTDWTEGDIGEIMETGEQFRVVSVATHVLTVLRSFNDTEGLAAADGGLLQKNPRFTIQQIDQGIDGVLHSFEMWGVHGFGSGTITRVTLQEFYELADVNISPVYGLLSIYWVDDNSLIPMPVPFRSAYLNLGVGDADYAVGTGVHILGWGNVFVGEDVQYVYASILDAVGDLTDNQSEILVLGATALVLGKAIIPGSHDPGARTNRAAQPGQIVRDGRWYQGEFFIRVRAEAAQLAVTRQRLPSTVRLSRGRRWRH